MELVRQEAAPVRCILDHAGRGSARASLCRVVECPAVVQCSEYSRRPRLSPPSTVAVRGKYVRVCERGAGMCRQQLTVLYITYVFYTVYRNIHNAPIHGPRHQGPTKRCIVNCAYVYTSIPITVYSLYPVRILGIPIEEESSIVTTKYNRACHHRQRQHRLAAGTADLSPRDRGPAVRHRPPRHPAPAGTGPHAKRKRRRR